MNILQVEPDEVGLIHDVEEDVLDFLRSKYVGMQKTILIAGLIGCIAAIIDPKDAAEVDANAEMIYGTYRLLGGIAVSIPHTRQ